MPLQSTSGLSADFCELFSKLNEMLFNNDPELESMF